VTPKCRTRRVRATAANQLTWPAVAADYRTSKHWGWGRPPRLTRYVCHTRGLRPNPMPVRSSCLCEGGCCGAVPRRTHLFLVYPSTPCLRHLMVLSSSCPRRLFKGCARSSCTVSTSFGCISSLDPSGKCCHIWSGVFCFVCVVRISTTVELTDWCMAASCVAYVWLRFAG
jgi:hypothetical protein